MIIAVLVVLLFCLVGGVDSKDIADLKRSNFKAALQKSVWARFISKEETEKAIEDRGHAPAPIKRNVTTNIFERSPSGSTSPSANPSLQPSRGISLLPSLVPSTVPSLPLPSSTPSTNRPTNVGGDPTNLPPIPLFPASTPPPRPLIGQPVTLPPIPLFPSSTRSPNLPPDGSPTQAPVLIVPTTLPPAQLPPTPAPNGVIPPSTLPPILIPPVTTAPPTLAPNEVPPPTPVPTPAAPTALTVEQFLTQTLTDDGSLQTPGTPQFSALVQLETTNPNLDPNLLADQVQITQRYALNTLFYATEGPTNWIASDLWTTAAPLCDINNPAANSTNWFGVTCETLLEMSLVTELTLRNNKIRGRLPSEIRGLRDLRTLLLLLFSY